MTVAEEKAAVADPKEPRTMYDPRLPFPNLQFDRTAAPTRRLEAIREARRVFRLVGTRPSPRRSGSR